MEFHITHWHAMLIYVFFDQISSHCLFGRACPHACADVYELDLVGLITKSRPGFSRFNIKEELGRLFWMSNGTSISCF